MKCSFLLNARRMTLDEDFYKVSRAGGYLFPPEGATKADAEELAAHPRRFVVADNGAFDDIGRIAQTASAITGPDRWERIRSELAGAAALVDTQSKLQIQMAVRPDAIVGAEDITLAVWLRAGLPEVLLRGDRKSLAARNAATAQRGLVLAETLKGTTVLTVASAHDYDTAFDAGKVFGAAGVKAAAIGFGAFMADDQWGSTAKVRGRIRRLPRSLPMRYVRTALVAKGFFDGWATVGGFPDHFHFLGLGAPIMLPVAVLPARRVPLITFDATSPIKDAISGSLYVSLPAPLTVRTWKVADRLATREQRWTCPCGFCRSLLADHPFDLEAASAVRNASTAPFTSVDLRAGSPLADALPLFRIATDGIGKLAERARIGHNHWVLSNLARNLTSHSSNLTEFIEERVHRYEQNAGAAHYAEAVRLAFEIVRPESEFWG